MKTEQEKNPTMTTLEDIEDAVTIFALQNPDGYPTAALLHKDDYARAEWFVKRLDPHHYHPTLGDQFKIYLWDGSDYLKNMFGGKTPKPGIGIISLNTWANKKAVEIALDKIAAFDRLAD